MLQVLQSIPDVTLCRRVWEWYCLRIKELLQTKYIHFPFDNQKLSFSVMLAFLFANIRIIWITVRKVNSLKVRNWCTRTMGFEWSSAMEQLHSGQLYNSEHGIHVGEKLRKKPTMQYTQNLVLNLEKFLKTFWNGLDCLTNSQTSYLVTNLPFFLYGIEK